MHRFTGCQSDRQTGGESITCSYRVDDRNRKRRYSQHIVIQEEVDTLRPASDDHCVDAGGQHIKDRRPAQLRDLLEVGGQYRDQRRKLR